MKISDITKDKVIYCDITGSNTEVADAITKLFNDYNIPLDADFELRDAYGYPVRFTSGASRFNVSTIIIYT